MSHRVSFPGGDDEVFRSVLLKHLPHALDVVARVAPITLGVHVTEVQAFLLARLDVRHGEGDLARHEGFPSAGRLVVEQNSIARVHVIRLAVVHHGPESHHFCHRVRRSRVKRRLLRLRDLLHFAVQLRRGRLVESRRLLLPGQANRFEQVQRPDAVNFGGVHRHLERHLHVRLRGEVIHLRRSHVAADRHEGVQIRQVAVVQEEILPVRVSGLHDVFQSRVVVRRRSSLDPVHRVPCARRQTTLKTVSRRSRARSTSTAAVFPEFP